MTGRSMGDEYDPGRWEDAYVLKSGLRKVHLAGDNETRFALCGQPIKPWTRPDPESKVCATCLKKAHRPQRDHVAKVRTSNKRKGAVPGPGQESIPAKAKRTKRA